MICCMTCPWVSSLGSPVSSPVSSPSRPRRTRSPSAASLVVPTIASTWRTSMYMDLRPHTLSDRSPPPRHQPSPPSRRRLSPPRHRPAGLCRHRPARLCRHRTAGLCRHRRRFCSAYHLFEAFNIRHFGSYVQQAKQDGGRRADVDSNVQ